MNHLQAVNTSAAERYLLEEMSEIERFAFEEHYFSCADCAEDVRMGALMRDGAKAGFAGTANGRSSSSVAGRASPRRDAWRPAVALPWAAAAALAVALGYQSLTPGRRQVRLEPQALTPITLRPASRGAEPVVIVDKRAAAVTLALDLMGQTAGLAYELRTANDKNVASGRIAAPPPGAPLLLLIRVWTLTPSEHYILAIRNANAGDVIGEYRFAVAVQ